MEIEKIFYFIIHPEFEGFLLYLRVIFIVISLIFLISIIILFLKTSWGRARYLEAITEFVAYRPFGVKETFKHWNKIMKRLETDREFEYKLAVIESDSLLDAVFKKMGYKGEDFIQKLEQIDPSVLSNLKEVWKAHKIRDNVVHDPDYQLTLDQAKTVLAIYEKALRELEVF